MTALLSPEDAARLVAPFHAEMATAVVGQRALAERILVALLTGGHLLLEGVPGVAKTLAVRTAAGALDLTFRRVQFTPDLLPADVIGTQIYRPETGTFAVKTGPVFANVVLADEVNRAPAKVQSALLEAMQERQVTLGDSTLPLPDPFIVLATQNPIEQEGTYPLPEAQLDRFMLKVLVDYPSRDEELAVLDRAGPLAERPPPRAVLGPAELGELRRAVDAVHVAPAVRGYITDLVRATRRPADYGLDFGTLLDCGASPRATIALFRASKATALLDGRDYVTPGDVKRLAPDVLRHRLSLSYEAEAGEARAEELVLRVLEGLTVP